MKRLLKLAPFVFFVLAACDDSAAQRWAKMQQRCESAQFTIAQCKLLFEIVENADDETTAANIGSGVAIGLAAGSRR